MKKLELNNLGVQEMNSVEMTKTDGGGIVWSSLSALLGNVTATANAVLGDTTQFLTKQLATVFSFIRTL
ncbi:hypothetical protein CPT03_06175 [Pedobacter ginsengisoli]|uniref:Bacteriocin n=1 Tax=Pedobacter ginsengisoli TaxID=363852 RepID=A0A2D1U3I6_9SPHI|nr:hypothetical protein [Pedobacter ginsengisoli]ATP56074.1 hypothetical protein CPT03_06175 [Pedobacter ginsengisoli]